MSTLGPRRWKGFSIVCISGGDGARLEMLSWGPFGGGSRGVAQQAGVCSASTPSWLVERVHEPAAVV